MTITQQQIQRAIAQQRRAARDSSQQVRLIAGPGSGKTYAIQERVRWLLVNGVLADRIFAISFTRAASHDLGRRILNYCQDEGLTNAGRVNVSTLHSLALRTLRAAGRLTYPAEPLVLDNWELENILDKEFSIDSGYRPGQTGGYMPSRCKEIREYYEALCSTGQQLPPNYIQPDPPISDTERRLYREFREPRTQLYSCVLPGEIVRDCVVHMEAGTLNPSSLLGIEHLVVDEYQDLNPADLKFVNALISSGVRAFVAGDDDQSIYSFRYASPSGIQSFTTRYPQSGDHELHDCFRCTSIVLETGSSLIAEYPGPNRIPKHLTSLYDDSAPPVPGVVHRWQFTNATHEAQAIASSCAQLISDELPPREIIILVSNTRTQLQPLVQALEMADVEFESPRATGFIETDAGRFILALLRIACDTNDYVSHRLILGSLPGVGPGVCNQIAHRAIAHNLNFRDLFHQFLLPGGVFQRRQITALSRARDVCEEISAWRPDEKLKDRSVDISTLVLQRFGQRDVQEWADLIAHLPPEITLNEVRDYLWADTDEQRASLLETVYKRLGISQPAGGLLPPKVRIMTMHGAKGLSSSIVFVPGLEENILPGTKRQPYPGLVLESARLLYVSITRAQAACILSYASGRNIYGTFSWQTASRFTAHLAGRFDRRSAGLSASEAEQIMQHYRDL